jgi:hypothetical protein
LNYVTMVGDVNPKAYDRLSGIYNFAGYPSCFFDGGYRVFVGGSSNQASYTTRISQSGARVVPPLDLLTVVKWQGSNTIEVKVRIGNGVPANVGPPDPTISSGPTQSAPNTSCEFESSVVDPDNDEMYYRFDWGDGSTSDWMGPFASGAKATASHSWQAIGDYDVRVQAKDEWDAETAWSAAYPITVQCCAGLRGNVDNDPADAVDIGDLVYLVEYSFSGGPAPYCLEEADVNGDGAIDIGDLVFMVEYSFSGGPAPLSCP